MPVWRKEHELARVTIHIFGMVITAIGLASVTGMLAPVVMHKFLSAFIILTGIAFFILSRGEAPHGGD